MAKNQHPIAQFRRCQRPPLSQDALGKQIGVDGMTVYRWEARKATPQPQHWDKLVEVTGISIAEILAARGGRHAEASAA